jgi:hypothetical protein
MIALISTGTRMYRETKGDVLTVADVDEHGNITFEEDDTILKPSMLQFNSWYILMRVRGEQPRSTFELPVRLEVRP